MTKEFIVSEIVRTANENGSKALGKQRFYQETGLKESDWYGKYWTRWSDAVKEAGFEPNILNAAFTPDFVLKKLADLVEELERFPTSGDLRIKARNDKDFPSHNSFNLYGNKVGLVNAFKSYCDQNGMSSLIRYCAPYLNRDEGLAIEDDEKYLGDNDFVYLYKSGIYYKIGRTNNLKRRDREIKLQLPFEAELIHSIVTDDAVGIEKYWHNRYADKRLNGEWFKLLSSDIKAFKRRKYM